MRDGSGGGPEVDLDALGPCIICVLQQLSEDSVLARVPRQDLLDQAERAAPSATARRCGQARTHARWLTSTASSSPLACRSALKSDMFRPPLSAEAKS